MTAPGTGAVLDVRTPLTGLADDPALYVTAPVAHGEAHGHTIETQPHPDAPAFLAIRITSPDGRVLNLVTAHAATLATLSPALSAAFNPNASAESKQVAAWRLDAILTAGDQCLAEGRNGSEARLVLQCAAEDITVETLSAWNRHPRLRAAGCPPLSPRKIVTLIHYGFSPETTCDWFETRRGSIDSVGEIPRRAAFRDAGWGPSHFRALVADLGLSRASKMWATIPPHQALLAARAGLSDRETAHLIRTGTWDEAAVTTLIALRDRPTQRALLAATP